ncbi:MAG: chromosomal replication initiator protein DnaA [Sphingomonadales bacterium]
MTKETPRFGGTNNDAVNPSMMEPWQDAWRRIRAKLRAEFGDATFDSWLKPLGVLRAEGAKVLITVPTRFMCDWVKTHYLGRITDYWRQETGAAIDVELVVSVQAPSPPPAVVTPKPKTNGGAARAEGQAEDMDANGADSYGAPLDSRFTFDSFVVGKSNELAHAAARRVSSSTRVQFNPLFLYGGVGLGKTHLMHAIAAEIRARDPERKVLYMSAEKFMYQFIRALRYKDTMAFKEQFRSVDVLMIDDVQFIAHKDSTQEEFFHTFNAVIDQHRQVIISGDRSPSDLEGIEDRIKSRLGWGLVADVHPTDYELRVGILQSKLEAMGRDDMPKEVTEFLARKIISNVRELEGALNRVTAYSDLVGRPVTLEMTQEVLQDLIRSNDRRVSIAEIQRHVAEYFNVRLSDLLSARRARAVARPRQVAMYLSKQLTSRSLPEIGRKFGGRDHTTVMHAVRRIEELRETDSGLDQDIENLRRTLET